MSEYYFIFKFIILCLFIVFISFISLFNAKHIIYVFIYVELILISCTLLILAIARLYDDLNGVILSLFLLGLIACETALGLIIVVSLRKKELTSK